MKQTQIELCKEIKDKLSSIQGGLHGLQFALNNPGVDNVINMLMDEIEQAFKMVEELEQKNDNKD